ncbi:hypothetical protein [Helicobacter magdeburgensis]|nr:hypothetical protein [Helicobacter magdeburgensis]
MKCVRQTLKSSEGGFSSPKHTADQSVATIAKTDTDIIPQTTLEYNAKV